MTPPEAIAHLERKRPAEVHVLIGQMGLGGQPRHPCDCPVAKLLVAMTADRTIRVFPKRIRWGLEGGHEWHLMGKTLRSVVHQIDTNFALPV